MIMFSITIAIAIVVIIVIINNRHHRRHHHQQHPRPHSHPSFTDLPLPVPQKKETFTYAKTILSLMCRYKHPEGKFLIIGGGQGWLGGAWSSEKLRSPLHLPD